MTFSFALSLLCILLSLGQDGRWLVVYGITCAFAAVSVGSSWLAICVSVILPVLNILAWLLLRRFAGEDAETGTIPRPASFQALLPVVATLGLELAVALCGASLGLPAILGVGLVLASQCVVACGVPLSQFCGLLMAADGLLVMACVLSSWGLAVIALVFWGMMLVLGISLLPRLAWQKMEERS